MKHLLHALVGACVLTAFAQAAEPRGTTKQGNSEKEELAGIAGAEVRQCEDRVASVRRDVLNRYETALDELQNTLQKAADLEGALAVRAEHQRVAKSGRLEEEDFASDLPALRALQAQTRGKLQELISQLVVESTSRLQELKRNLTIAGRLDEAVEARTALDRLQTKFLPLSTPDITTPIAVSTLLRLYAADRTRTDGAYKGQRIALHGVVAGFRADPADARQYLVYLAESGGQGWVQCTFSAEDCRFREERQINTPVLVLAAKAGGEPVRLQRGSLLTTAGTCEGWAEPIRFVRCTVVR